MRPTRHLVRALTLTIAALGLACGRTPTPPPVVSIAFTSPDAGAVLNTADNTDPGAPSGSIGITVTGLATGVSVGSAVTLTVDAASPMESTIQPGLTASFPHVYLAGSNAGESHLLTLAVNDSGGGGSANAAITVTVLLSGGCPVTLSPVSNTLFNESGGPVTGFTVVQDTDLTTPGMQADLTVTGSGSVCTDGTPVTLTVGMGTPLTGNLAGGSVIFKAVTLPDTPIAALTDMTQQLVVTAKAGGNPGISQYVVDSNVPTATITLPQNGASFGDAQDVDPAVPGLQINVAGSTNGFQAQIDAGYTISFQIVDSNGMAYTTIPATVTLAADGTFLTEMTLPNGTPSLIFKATGVTGNVTMSPPVQVNVSATPVIAIIRPSAGDLLNIAANQVPGAPQMNTTVAMTTTAAAMSPVDVCSTVAPSAGAGACMNSSAPSPSFEVGRVNANGANTSLFPAVLGDGQQTLYAAVDGVVSTGVQVIVHTARPQITSVTVDNAFDGGANLWLNNSNLDGGSAWATVSVRLAPTDVFALPDGGSPSTLFINDTNNSAIKFSSLVDSQTSPPQAIVPVSLLDNAYPLQISVTDPYGNANDQTLVPNPADFDLLVKATLPGCDITSPLGPYFNVANNGGMENAGNVSLPVKLAASSVTATDVNGNVLPGQATVFVDGTPGTPVAVTTPVVQAPTLAAQGLHSLTGQVVDPAGNPAQACINSVSLDVATVNPTLVITALNPDGTNTNGVPYYNGRDAGISIASTDAEAGQPVTVNVVTGNANAQFATLPLTPPTTTTTLSDLPSGLLSLTATVTDLAGNTGTTANGGTQIQVIASGCSLVVTTPSNNPAFFNGAGAVGGVASPPVSFYTPDCDGGTVTLFNTLDGGSTAMSSLNTSAVDGTVTFNLSLHDGDQGSFYASIANGQSTPTVYYAAKFTGPVVGGLTPDAGSVWVVAQSGNPTAGTTIDGGVLVLANQYVDQTQGLTDFQVSGLTNLGPTDSANHIGKATLTTNFTTGASTYGPFLLNVGQTSVDFPVVLLPPHDNGTVTLTLQDSAQNTTTESWSVLTDVIPPGAPQLTATTNNPRAASFNLSWVATADDNTGSTAPVAGYALGWSTTVNPLSEAQFNQMTLDPGAATLAGATVGTQQTYLLTGLPAFNSFFLELRAVDAVGNRSALTPASSVFTISDGGIPNTLQVATISGPAGVRFGYRLANGDFNGDTVDDLAIAATNPSGTGTVYLVPGGANLATNWNQAIGSITGVQAIASGADAGDLFGYALAVGDFNGDGVDDLAVGAPLFNNAQGLVQLFFGSKTGFPATPSVSIQGGLGNQGSGNKNFGSMVAAVGPVGDGGAGVGLMIGAPFDGTGGTSYLFYQRASWAGITSYTQADTTFTGQTSDGGLGFRYGAVPLGDVNNDGTPDFTVPASPLASLYMIEGSTLQSTEAIGGAGTLATLSQDTGCTGGGNTFGTCFGGTALGNVPLATGGASLIVADSAANTIYIYDFTPTNLNPAPVVIAPPTVVGTSAYFGWSMVQSDINGDGHPDLLLGTQNNVSPTGVFYMVNSGTSPYFSQSPSANLLQPTASYFGFAIAAGNFSGGAPDVAGSDPFGLNEVWVYY